MILVGPHHFELHRQFFGSSFTLFDIMNSTTTTTMKCHSSHTFNSRRQRRRLSSLLYSLIIISIVCSLLQFTTLLSVAEAAASTFAARRRTTIASASIHHRRPSSSSSSSYYYYNSYCFARPNRNGVSNKRNQQENNHHHHHNNRSTRRSSSSSWPWLLLSTSSSLFGHQSKSPSLGSYDELCDSLQHLEDISTSRSSSRVILASSSSRATAAPRASKKGLSGGESAVVAERGDGVGVGYDELTPLGRCVYGSVEVAIVTLTDFVSGCFGGYMIGVVTDIPRLLFKSVEQQGAVLQSSSSFWSQVSSRMSRMHGKSWRWGKEWGTISAVFGASRVVTKVVRGGKEDEWSTVLSSMAAGAYFARKEGPQAMIKGALLYGGFVYLLSGNLALKKKPFQYEEKPIDF